VFCTGDIRCEKASAYMLQNGFPQVYHPQGGISATRKTSPQNRAAGKAAATSSMSAAVKHSAPAQTRKRQSSSATTQTSTGCVWLGFPFST
jgi:hypothetical protein